MRGRPGKFGNVPLGSGRFQSALYAVEFTDGIVKIGRTGMPRERMRQLNRDAVRRGCALRRIFVSREVHEQPYFWAEKALISRLMRIANARPGRLEYFTNVSFGAETTLVRQMASRMTETA